MPPVSATLGGDASPSTPSAPRGPSPEAPAAGTPASAPAAPLARGRELTTLLYQDRLGELWSTFLPSARAPWGDLPAFEAFRAEGRDTYGPEASLLHEAVIEDDGVTSYVRTVTFEGDPNNEWTLMFSFDAQGNVSHFEIAAADAVPPQ
ncbi:hypothetical protein [Deinococcus aetherius]|uniref:hypothetical protein n=1 Tax=Deinococcus aetherius TaxID=200252 RepID=UPI0022320901|nr:hypothetical protein [Deinococcus aetherius]